MRLFARAFVLAATAAALLFSASAPALAQAPGVNADTFAALKGSYSKAGVLGAPTFPFDVRVFTKFAGGVGTGVAPSNADLMYAGTNTIAASGSANLDLAGTLTDPFGVTLNCVKVKLIWVQAAPANTNNVVLGGAASNGFLGPFGAATHTVAIPPGGVAMFVAPAAGWTVTAATGDLLQVANSSSGTPVTYNAMIFCTSS